MSSTLRPPLTSHQQHLSRNFNYFTSRQTCRPVLTPCTRRNSKAGILLSSRPWRAYMLAVAGPESQTGPASGVFLARVPAGQRSSLIAGPPLNRLLIRSSGSLTTNCLLLSHQIPPAQPDVRFNTRISTYALILNRLIISREFLDNMAPSAVSEPAPAAVVATTKSQPTEKVEKEVTPLEAISHGDVLPSR